MVITVVSSVIASDIIINITVAGCMVFAVTAVLSDEKRRPTFALLSRHITVFMIPLVILFAYTTIVWLARIMVGF